MIDRIIGIDEVGRGALAGPVVVAAVAITINRKTRISNNLLGSLKDSKKLTAVKRKLWFEYFKTHPQINYALGRAYPRKIEKINISAAANLAAERALKRLFENCKLKIKNCSVFLDGGLYLKSGKWQAANGKSVDAKTVVRGDEKITAVKIASIIAKVSRDRYMLKLAEKHPVYGFETHKGYGTEKHRQAIRRYGPCHVHRLTFLGKCRSI